MADEITEGTEPTTEPAPTQGDGIDWKAESRKWESRAKASNERVRELESVDMEELRAKAARLDELESANKSELERIAEQAEQARKSASDWQSKYEELEATRQHEMDVRRAAGEYGVDADVLMRMGGDVDENARFLQGKEAARPKFGDMHDGGDGGKAPLTKDEILAVKDRDKRLELISQNLSLFGR